MQEALEEHGGLLVADAQAAEVLEPGDRTFHRPATAVSSQRATVLGHVLRPAAPAVRRNHLDALIVQVLVERIAVVRLVADDPIRRVEAGGTDRRSCALRATDRRLATVGAR